MTFFELVSYFRNNGSYEKFYQDHFIDDPEEVDIFMLQPFDINSEITFVEFEKTDGALEIQLNNIKYHYLIELEWIVEASKEAYMGEYKLMSDKEIAERFLYYAIYDA